MTGKTGERIGVGIHLRRIAILFGVLTTIAATSAAQRTVAVVTGDARVDQGF